VSREAPPEEIRRRYRELLLQHHPDKTADKAAAHETTLRIVWAYQVLTSPDRRQEYLAAGRAGDEAMVREVEQDVVAQAEAQVFRGEWAVAVEPLKGYLETQPQDAYACYLLSEAYAGLGDIDRAVSMLTLACQFDPENILYADRFELLSHKPRRTAGKRRQPVKEEAAVPRAADRPEVGRNRAVSAGAVAVGPLILGGLGFWWTAEGPFGLTMGVAGGLPLAAYLSGLALSVGRLLSGFEEELVAGGVGRVGQVIGPPLLVWLVALGAVSVYLALIGYVAMATMEGAWSRSVMIVFAMALALAWLAAGMVPTRWPLLATFGGNASLLLTLAGWASGRMFRRAW